MSIHYLDSDGNPALYLLLLYDAIARIEVNVAQLPSKAVLLLAERIAAAAARYNNNTRLGASLGNILSQLPQSIQLLIYNKLINTNLW